MGAGSIGSVVGGLLHRGGHDVYLVGKGPHIEAVIASGLRITGLWGDYAAEDIKATGDLARITDAGFEPEWTLLCVKSYDTAAAMEDLAPILARQRGVVSLQNGLGNIEVIGGAAPGMAVGGRVIFGASTIEPGLVEVTVCADDVLLGPAPGGPAGVEEVVEAFASSDIPCRYEERILSFIWDKVLYNVCLNALATLLRTDYGSLADDPDSSAVMERLVDESYQVARAQGVDLPSHSPRQYLDRFARELLPPTRDHRSSMQEDIEQGRPTEIEALNGAIARMGAAAGIETPANEVLAAMIRALDRLRTDV